MIVNRRIFGKLAGAGAAQLLTAGTQTAQAEQKPAPEKKADAQEPEHRMAHIPARNVEWPAKTYRRLLVDTHVPDWDDRLLASFDAGQYVSTIAAAGFQSLMQYANSHVGLCLWRTKIGQMHRNMKGRDYFGEVMEECKRHGLHRVAYYSLVYDDWAYRNYPEWRILPAAEPDPQAHERAGTLCINSPYPEHAVACVKELVSQYDFESIFFDMTFWPFICICAHCAARFRKEQGKELPRVVNWSDPHWRSFQESRQRWMREFGMKITEAVKQTRPITAYHQFGTIFAPWTVGVSLAQNQASDFAAGDFYGGAAQFSIVCKAYLGITRKRPFEFMTSRTLNLTDFETTKPFEQLALESMIPMIHSSSCLLIDAIKPEGTLNPRAYEYLSQINALHDAYEPFLGGEMLADVAIYFDKNSMYDPDAKGLTVAEAAANMWGVKGPHLDSAVGAARFLREAHIPFGVVTNVSLDQLGRYRAVILPSVVEMSVEQAHVFREFVREGGALYASGRSSLSVPGDGAEQFLLEDVLGIQYEGLLVGRTSYLSTADREIADAIWPQENIGFSGAGFNRSAMSGTMVRSKALEGTEILATITPPFVDPDAGDPVNTRFAQIWSNPPDTKPGQIPGITLHTFGKGKAIWIAAALESHADAVNARIFGLLLKRILPLPYHFEADTDRAVEVTVFHQEEQRRLLVGMLNLQTQLPAIPVDATIRVQIPRGFRIKRVSLLPEEKELGFTPAGSYVSFHVPTFSLVAMAMVYYV